MDQYGRLFFEQMRMFCVLVVVCFAYNEANAHAALVKSDPGRRATLASAPAKIKLWFNEKLEPAYSTVKLHDSNGNVIGAEVAVVDNENPKLVSIAIPVLKPGSYRVKYRVLSLDGHIVESSFTFAIRPPR